MEGVAEGSDASFTGFGASAGGFGASTGGFGASSEGTFGAGGFGEGTFGAGGFGEAQQFGSTDFGGGGFGQPPAAFGSGSTGFGEAQGPHTTTGTTGGFGAGGFGASDGGFGAPASGAAPGSFGASTGGFGASTGGFGASSEGTFGAGGFGEGTFGAGGFGEAQQFGSTDFGGGGFGQPPAAFGGGSTGFGQTPAFPATKLEVIAEGFGVGYPMTSNPFEAFPTADSGPQFSYQAFPTAGSGPPEFFYHGTSLEAAMKIQQVGFDVGRSGSNNGAQLGRGLYVTTTMQKALNYAAKHPCQGAIFELKVDLGRCYTVHVNDSNRAKWQEMGYDSAWAPEGVLPAAGSFEENCIKDPRPPRVQITKVSLGHTGEAKRAGYWIDSAGKLQKGLTFSLPFGFGGPAPTKLAPKPVVPPRDASNSEDCKSQTSKGSSKSASSRISSISSMLKRRFLQRTGFGVAASDSSSVCQDFDSDTSSVYHVCHVFDDDSDTSSVVGSGEHKKDKMFSLSLYKVRACSRYNASAAAAGSGTSTTTTKKRSRNVCSCETKLD